MRFLYPALAAFTLMIAGALADADAPADIDDTAALSNVTDTDTGAASLVSNAQPSCFPAIGFHPPKGRAPSIPAYRWWCSRSSEYAFLGFSYSVDDCPSKARMTKDFTSMRSMYKARYVRIYSVCEGNNRFYDDVVAAAYGAGIGVYAMVWFGFNGPNDHSWEGRLSGLVNTITHNRLASYVIRSVAIGSEALFDGVITGPKLAASIKNTQAKLRWLGIEVTTSDMAYKLAANTNVLGAADHLQLNVLPFFAQSATYGNSTNAKAQVLRELGQMRDATRSRKKIVMTQTGWPSNEFVWKANAAHAEASLHSEQKYYDMLDGQCWTFKTFPKGGVGWFAQIWEDNTLPGWGIVKNGVPKFVFKPKISC